MRLASQRTGKKLAQEIKEGKRPELKAQQLKNLDKGRANNWNNLEYINKMKDIASKTMAKTNKRRAAGDFPIWDANSKLATSIRTKKAWEEGNMRPSGKKGSNGFRSKWEERFAQDLASANINFIYEPKAFKMKFKDKDCTYTVDFYLPESNHYIEIKGHWWDDSKEKTLAFMEQYPDLKYSVLKGPKYEKLEVVLGAAWGTPTQIAEVIKESTPVEVAKPVVPAVVPDVPKVAEVPAPEIKVEPVKEVKIEEKK